MKKQILILSILSLSLTLLAGCSNNNDTENHKKETLHQKADAVRHAIKDKKEAVKKSWKKTKEATKQKLEDTKDKAKKTFDAAKSKINPDGSDQSGGDSDGNNNDQ